MTVIRSIVALKVLPPGAELCVRVLCCSYLHAINELTLVTAPEIERGAGIVIDAVPDEWMTQQGMG